jgi:hypothetical protein
MTDRGHREASLGDAALFAFLILVGAVVQPPFDVEGIALLDIFGGRLSQPVPADDRVELRFFLAFDGAVGGQANARDGFPVLGVSQPSIAGGVADEDDFVDTAHPSIIAGPCKKRV